MISKCALTVAVVAVLSASASAQVAAPACAVAAWTMSDLPASGVTVIESVTTEATAALCATRCGGNDECLAFAFKSDGGVNTCQLYSAAAAPNTLDLNGAIPFYLRDCCAGMGVLTAAASTEFAAGDINQCRMTASATNEAVSYTLSSAGMCKVYHGAAVTGLVKGEDNSYAGVTQQNAPVCPRPSLAALSGDLDRFEITVVASGYTGTEIAKTEYQPNTAYECMEACRMNKSCLAVTFAADGGKSYCTSLSSVTAVKPYVAGDAMMTAIPANCIYDKSFASGNALAAVTALSAEHCAQLTYLGMGSDSTYFFTFDTTADKDNCRRFTAIGPLEASNGKISGTVAGCRSVADYGSGRANGSAAGRFGSVASSMLTLVAALVGFAVYVF